MNRTIKEATVKRYHYGSHQQLKEHLKTFLLAYNFAKRLKTLKGRTPYEHIIQCWQKEPQRFKVNPMHHTTGLNIYNKCLQYVELAGKALAQLVIKIRSGTIEKEYPDQNWSEEDKAAVRNTSVFFYSGGFGLSRVGLAILNEAKNILASQHIDIEFITRDVDFPPHAAATIPHCNQRELFR